MPASPFTIPHLFTGLDLLLAVLEVGEPQPVEEERRHAEDEEEGEGVPSPPHRAVAQQQLGAEHAQAQHDVNISGEYSRGDYFKEGYLKHLCYCFLRDPAPSLPPSDLSLVKKWLLYY